jgi:hypothetical protein
MTTRPFRFFAVLMLIVSQLIPVTTLRAAGVDDASSFWDGGSFVSVFGVGPNPNSVLRARVVTDRAEAEAEDADAPPKPPLFDPTAKDFFEVLEINSVDGPLIIEDAIKRKEDKRRQAKQAQNRSRLLTLRSTMLNGDMIDIYRAFCTGRKAVGASVVGVETDFQLQYEFITLVSGRSIPAWKKFQLFLGVVTRYYYARVDHLAPEQRVEKRRLTAELKSLVHATRKAMSEIDRANKQADRDLQHLLRGPRGLLAVCVVAVVAAGVAAQYWRLNDYVLASQSHVPPSIVQQGQASTKSAVQIVQPTPSNPVAPETPPNDQASLEDFVKAHAGDELSPP